MFVWQVRFFCFLLHASAHEVMLAHVHMLLLRTRISFGQNREIQTALNPLSPNRDQHQFSPHHISALQHIKVMRIKRLIKKDELS